MINQDVWTTAEIRVGTQRKLSNTDVAKEFGISTNDLDADVPVTPVEGRPGYVRVGIKSSTANATAGRHPGFVTPSSDFYFKG